MVVRSTKKGGVAIKGVDLGWRGECRNSPQEEKSLKCCKRPKEYGGTGAKHLQNREGKSQNAGKGN